MTIRVGTSGWNYPTGAGTWNGVFYPKPRPKGFDELAFYAQFFNFVELNTTFYGQPRAEVAAQWAARTPPHFEFAVKLYQQFTHPKMFRQRVEQTLAKHLGTDAHRDDRYDYEYSREELEPFAVTLERAKRRSYAALNNHPNARAVRNALTLKELVGDGVEPHQHEAECLRTPPMSIDWSAFDGFRRPVEHRSWAGVIAWTSAIEEWLGPRRDALARLRQSSDDSLVDLGGDPSARDWTSFRALRREREEDWSDWLAQLIEDSKPGRFASFLLGAIEHRSAPSDYLAAEVYREVPYEGRRADLVIAWSDARYTHIEVKVGDSDFAKALETAQKMAKCFGCDLTDIVLLLPEQQEAWKEECNRQPELLDRFRSLTWVEVARALRRALPQSADESIHWRVWAHVFCGAVEQVLLGMRSGREPVKWARSLTFQGLDTAAKLFAPNRED